MKMKKKNYLHGREDTYIKSTRRVCTGLILFNLILIFIYFYFFFLLAHRPYKSVNITSSRS